MLSNNLNHIISSHTRLEILLMYQESSQIFPNFEENCISVTNQFNFTKLIQKWTNWKKEKKKNKKNRNWIWLCPFSNFWKLTDFKNTGACRTYSFFGIFKKLTETNKNFKSFFLFSNCKCTTAKQISGDKSNFRSFCILSSIFMNSNCSAFSCFFLFCSQNFSVYNF